MKDDEVRIAIQEAALRVFQKWGLNKTTMEDIASEAGKGKSTLYYYYKSKEEIFYEAVSIEIGQTMSKAKAEIDTIDSAKGQMKQYIVSILKEIKNTSALYTILHGEIKGNRVVVEKLKLIFKNSGMDVIERILQHGINTKEFSFVSEEELQMAATVLIGILNSMMLYLFLENGQDDQIDMAAKFIAHGL